MTDMRPRTVPTSALNARLAQIGVVIVVANLLAAVWIGVAVASRPNLKPVVCHRVTPTHAATPPASRPAAAEAGVSPVKLGRLQLESRLGVAARGTC